ncbi:MAG: DegV family protein [Firmicutes bacterium]|jgi:DegV family protein with EDD domain|nr:DegV family protein [Bacillota bacterium]
MSRKLIIDSGCDLPLDHNIEIEENLPILVYVDDKEYKDKVEIYPKDMYKMMRDGSLVRTAQIPYAYFREKFEQYAKTGDEYLYIVFSSGLSGTYNTARLVYEEILEDYPDFKMEIVDSLNAVGGYGVLVKKASEILKDYDDIKDLGNRVREMSKYIESIFTVDDLEYLFRGGRVSRTSALLGGVLNIKPILEVRDGKLDPLEKIRGKKKVYKRIVEMVKERLDGNSLSDVYISHADDIDSADKLKEKLLEAFDIEDIEYTEVSCAIGAHSGPGTLAVFFYNEK